MGHPLSSFISSRAWLVKISTVVAATFFALGTVSAVSAQTSGINSPVPTGSLPSGQSTLVPPIGPGDQLEVSVVGEPDLSTQYQVDANGDITMLYVGKVHVGGLTPDQAGDVIKNKLGTIYVDPEVTLTRAEMGGDSIQITGAVVHQGSETVRRDSTLNDVVQMAIPSTDADLTRVQITRGLPGQPHQNFTVDVATFLNTGESNDNPQLADGDVIFIPSKNAITNSVACMGAVLKPGRFYVAPGTTAADLITQAGGLTPDADKANCYIQSLGSTDHQVFDYDKATENPADPTINPVLNDSDEVVIPVLQVKPIFSINGGVLRPGQYPIDGPTSLTEAEAAAGGLQDRAQTKKTVITRTGTDGKPQIIKLDSSDPVVAANFTLQPGDIVTIPQGHPRTSLDPLGILGTITSIVTLGAIH